MFRRLLAPKHNPPLVSDVQLAFSLPMERQLDLGQSYEALAAWQFISQHICRYPLDLRAHTQRILLARQQDLQSRLPGSLLDLFLALGKSGQALKQSLFEWVAPFMDEADQLFFKQALDDPEGNHYQPHWLFGSVLASGEQHSGQPLLAKVSDDTVHEYADVLTEARACLEYGQVDRAQQLLEKEIMEQRHTPDVETELLSIYHHTQDKDSLEKFTEILKSQDIQPTEAWIQLHKKIVNR